MPCYDYYGYLSSETIPGRETAVLPPPEAEWPAGQRPNWTGYEWIYLPYPLPAPVPVDAPGTLLTPAEFRARFTDAELLAFVRLSRSDEMAGLLMLRLSTASDGLDLASDSVHRSLDYLTARGVLTAERAQAIMTP